MQILLAMPVPVAVHLALAKAAEALLVLGEAVAPEQEAAAVAEPVRVGPNPEVIAGARRLLR